MPPPVPQIPFLDEGCCGWNISEAATSAFSPAAGSEIMLSLLFFAMRYFGIFTHACTLLLATVFGPSSSSASSVFLPSYPLAVKNPYLSAWLPGNQVQDVATGQPEFWAGQPLNWPILARVDDETYSLFGMPDSVSGVTAATTTSVNFTSSHTIFKLTAGDAEITLDFFSPVLPGPKSYARQALPYSYLTVSAISTSKQGPSVRVLTSIDHTWTAQNGAAELNFTTSGSASYYQFSNPNEVPFTEKSDMATYGSVILATTQRTGISNTCGPASSVISSFVESGSLDPSESCSGTDLAAISGNLGTLSSHGPRTLVFAVGLDREKTINYLGQSQTGYHHTQWPTISSAVQFFLKDYSSVAATSRAFDEEVRSRSEAVSATFGDQYADINEASMRQTFGGLEITVPADDLTAEPTVFLKEISSDGNMNTVDFIYQSWPIFLSLNPDYIRMMLDPVLSYSTLPPSESWPLPWVIHDIGTHYPNATGHNDGKAEQMPLFETSSMFIMLLGYQKYSGDNAYAQKYRDLLEGWAEYLVPNSLYPSSQLISVDAIPATANQTGLAIQSTIGLKAASVLLGNDTYSDIADSFVDTIYNQGLGLDGEDPSESSHFTYNYGQPTTWNVLFPAWSDVLLDLKTFPEEAWAMQSDWYLSQIQELGLPFAGPITDLNYTGSPLMWGLTDWNIVASGASSTELQEAVVNTTHAFLTNGMNVIPFGTKYNVEGPEAGKWIGNRARSSVGSHFALLTLDQGTWGVSY